MISFKKYFLLNEDLADLSHKLYNNKNFMNWFGESKVVNLDGRPLIMFHGTSANFDQFSDEYVNIGLAQYGIGHYFTSNPEVASTYSSKQGSNQIGANIRPVVLKIESPSDAEEEFRLNKTKVIKLIKMAPNLNETLENWGDISHEGYNKVLNSALNAAVSEDNLYTIRRLTTIGNDFYSHNSGLFLKNIKNIFGIDGVRVNDEIYIAYFPNQIMNVYKALVM